MLLYSSHYTPSSVSSVTCLSCLSCLSLMARDAGGILTLGEQTVMAKTDGSLQIQIPDPTNPGRSMNWHRQYYAVPLEVRSYILFCVCILFRIASSSALHPLPCLLSSAIPTCPPTY